MSLDDKFYPEDGTVLIAVDNALIKAAGRVGELYQHLTGRNAKKLCRSSFGAASLLTAAGAVYCPFLTACLYYPVSRYVFSDFKTPLEERLIDESVGLPKLSATTRLVYSGAALFIISSSGYALYEHGVRSISSLMEQKLDLALVLNGVGMIMASFGSYLSRSQLPPPPEKHIFAHRWDKLKGMLETRPQPAPEAAAGYLASPATPPPATTT